MRKLILSGWNVGFDKVGLTKLLRNDLEYSLSQAKEITDAVLEGQSVSLDLKEDQVEQMALKLNALHAKFVLEMDAEVEISKM
jgi:hypothetical protein